MFQFLNVNLDMQLKMEFVLAVQVALLDAIQVVHLKVIIVDLLHVIYAMQMLLDAVLILQY